MDIYPACGYNPLVFEHVTLHLQVQAAIHVVVSLPRFMVSSEQPGSSHPLLSGYFSGVRALAVPFHLSMPICLPFQRAKVFFHHWVQEVIGFQVISPSLIGFWICWWKLALVTLLVSLGSNQTILPQQRDPGGKPLLKPQHTHGCGHSSERKITVVLTLPLYLIG